MNNQQNPLKVPEPAAGSQSHDVYRYSLITAAVMALATIALLYFFGAPANLYSTTYWAGLVCLMAFFSAWLARQGRSDLGLGLVIGSILIGVAIPSLETSGLSIALGVVALIAIFSLSQLMQSRGRAWFANAASIATTLILLALDLFEPFARTPNTDVTSTWIVAGGVTLAYVAIMIWRRLETTVLTFQDDPVQRAVFVIQNIAVNALLFAALAFYLTIQTGGAWQAIQFIILALQVTVIGFFVSVPLIRRGQTTLGAWIFFASALIAPVWAALLISKLGYTAAAWILVTNYFTIRYVIDSSRRSQRIAMALAVLGMLISLVLEALTPAWRLESALMLTVSPILTGLLGLIFIAIIVRQAWTSNIRTRLFATFIVLAAVPVLVTGGVSVLITSQNTRGEVLGEVAAIAQLRSNEIRAWTSTLQTSLGSIMQDTLTLNRASSIINNSVGANTNKLSLRKKFNDLNQSTGYFEELFVMDMNGVIVMSTNEAQEGKIVKNQAYYEVGLEEPYVAPPAYDVGLSSYSILFTRPIKDVTGATIGVVAGRANLEVVNQIMTENIGLGETNETYLVGKNYALLTQSRFEDMQIGSTYIRTEGATNAIESQTPGSGIYNDYRDTPVLGAYLWMPELQVAVISEQNESEALIGANQALATTVGLMILTVLIAGVAAFLVTRTIANPISELVKVAESATAGNLNVAATVHRADEIGALATAFNAMTSRLSESIGTLEQRVAERTKDLETVAEVGTATATILETENLLQEVVNLTKERFNLYYSLIYLLDDKKQTLALTAASGESAREMVAEGHLIPFDHEKSVIARAARERRGVIVSDASREENFLPHPRMPDTLSELAVPLIAGGSLIGVFDIQSGQVGRFTEADISVQSTLAAQISTSIQNVRSFEESKAQAELESLVNIVGQRIQQSTTVEETLQIAIREVSAALGASRVGARIKKTASAQPEKAQK